MNLEELEYKTRETVAFESEAVARRAEAVKSARARGRQLGFEMVTRGIADRADINVVELRRYCTISSEIAEYTPFLRDGYPVRVPQLLVISIDLPDHEPILCKVGLRLNKKPVAYIGLPKTEEETQIDVCDDPPFEFLVNCLDSVMRTNVLGRALVASRDDRTARTEAIGITQGSGRL